MIEDIFKKMVVFGTIILFFTTGLLSSVNAEQCFINVEKKEKALEKIKEFDGDMDPSPLLFRCVEFFCGRITNVTKDNDTIEFEALRLFYLLYFRIFFSDIGLFMRIDTNGNYWYDDNFKFIGTITDDFICGFIIIRWWEIE